MNDVILAHSAAETSSSLLPMAVMWLAGHTVAAGAAAGVSGPGVT